MQAIGHDAFSFYQGKKDELCSLSDSQLQLLLKQASRCSVRLMFEFSVAQIKDALGALGVDIQTQIEGLGDKRKKATYIKTAIFSLSSLSQEMTEAINQLSYVLGIQNNEYLEDDEKLKLQNLRNQADIVLVPSDEKVAETIKEVDAAIVTVRQVSKKVTQAEAKLRKQAYLNNQIADVRWESDFLGVVHLGNQSREFWVTDPYTNPIVNVVASNSTVILSSWDSTKENPFVLAALRAFHCLMDERTGKNSIEDRLLTLSMQLLGSKKRANWYAQSHEGLVLKDGERMQLRAGGQYLFVQDFFEVVDFSQGTAYKRSQHCAREYSHRYQYVEGFALLNHKLFHHAWLKDRIDGKAVEVTLKDQEIEYFGITFDIDWVDKVIASRLKDDTVSDRNSQSIIEGNFLDDFKLLKSGSPKLAIA